MEIIRYRLIAEKLLKEDNSISIEKLALLTNLPIEEITQVLKEFNSLGFLTYTDNYQKILLNVKARTKKS